jgi:hypothetical protein
MMNSKSIIKPFFAAMCFSAAFSGISFAAQWPASNSEADGILWFWGTHNLTGEIVDENGDWAREGEAILRHQARATWFQGVSPRRGYVEAADTGSALARTMESQPNLYLEAALHPYRDSEPLQGILFWMGTFGDDLIWQLRLKDNRLWIDRPEHDPVPVADLEITTPTHLAFAMNGENAQVWINGALHSETPATAPPEVEDPWDVITVFGGAPGSNLPMNGSLEYLVIGTRAETAEAHATAWREAFEARTAPETHTVRATLTAHAREPREEDLSEYGNALLGMVWTLNEPLPDELKAGETFFAWHWYVLNSRVYPDSRPPEPGTVHTLVLSPANKQPHLNGVQQLIDDLDPDDLLLLKDFYLVDLVSDGETNRGE